MPNNFIYIHNEGAYDLSRWLHITAPSPGECTLHLQDLCHPGRVSHLLKASCPVDFLKSFIDHGPLQLTTRSGYVLLRRVGEVMEIEFRGNDDTNATRVNVLIEEVRKRVDALVTESAALRAA